MRPEWSKQTEVRSEKNDGILAVRPFTGRGLLLSARQGLTRGSDQKDIKSDSPVLRDHSCYNTGNYKEARAKQGYCNNSEELM